MKPSLLPFALMIRRAEERAAWRGNGVLRQVVRGRTDRGLQILGNACEWVAGYAEAPGSRDNGGVTKYEMILYWSAEDGAFIADVPELPGCASDGITRQEAVANAEGAIQEWIETARELGRPIPAPRGRVLLA